MDKSGDADGHHRRLRVRNSRRTHTSSVRAGHGVGRNKGGQSIPSPVMGSLAAIVRDSALVSRRPTSPGNRTPITRSGPGHGSVLASRPVPTPWGASHALPTSCGRVWIHALCRLRLSSANASNVAAVTPNSTLRAPPPSRLLSMIYDVYASLYTSNLKLWHGDDYMASFLTAAGLFGEFVMCRDATRVSRWVRNCSSYSVGGT